MSASQTYSWWQYSRWVTNIGRNARITNPTDTPDPVLAAFRTFLKLFWNPETETGSRPWLKDDFQKKAVQVPGDLVYKGDLDEQPAHVLVELVELVGRDLKKVPITDAEVAWADALIAITGNLRYGTGPLFGGTSGSTVGV